ncbi:hypothetical protein F5887DRAFT_1075651 [Amanita rubescens]|nr:hypothetical protein F5887DRAFT_1075651 [Amanita rubescens]
MTSSPMELYVNALFSASMLIHRRSGADCTCNTGLCLSHFEGIPGPSPAEDNRNPYIDQGSDLLFVDYGYRVVFNSRKLSVRSGATIAASEASHLANPDPPLGENHPRSIYSLPSNASPSQLPYLTLDTGYFRSDFPPSLNSASTDATMCPSDTVSLQPPTYLETMYSPGVKSVGSALMRMASNRRRRKRGEHPCLFPGCPADFSSLHNREYHMNAHLGLRPYKCEYKAFGCEYEASAPRTVKRHNATCKYKPENS